MNIQLFRKLLLSEFRIPRGESVKAVLVLKSNQKASEQDIIDYCRANLSAYKVPQLVEFREVLPKTNVGKILRRALKRRIF